MAGSRWIAAEVSDSERRLLRQLAARISNRLEAEFTDELGGDRPHVGVRLNERDRGVVLELPRALLAQAREDPTARESVRVRLKSARDRMLFRPPPRPLPKRIEGAMDPGAMRFGDRRGRR